MGCVGWRGRGRGGWDFVFVEEGGMAGYARGTREYGWPLRFLGLLRYGYLFVGVIVRDLMSDILRLWA